MALVSKSPARLAAVLFLTVCFFSARGAMAQSIKVEKTEVEKKPGADLIRLSLGAAGGAVVGGLLLPGMGLASEPAANAGNEGLALAMVGTGLFAAAAAPATGVLLVASSRATGPELTWPAATVAGLATPIGVILGAMVGWPLGVALFGDPGPEAPLSDPTLQGVVASTLVVSGLFGVAMAAGGAALGGFTGHSLWGQSQDPKTTSGLRE
jgi:hypothetical protein